MLRHIKRLFERRGARYVFSGGVSYGVELASFLFFYYVVRLESGVANACSLFVALLVNYLLAHHFVFIDYAKNVKRSLPRYVLLVSFNIAASSVIVSLLVSHFNLKAYLVKPVVSACFAAWTYVAYKKFVFLKNAELR